MVKIKFYSVVLTLFFIACAKNTDNKSVILTTSFSSNPKEPRFGLEIKDDTLFYCEEIIERPGTYNYFYCNNTTEKIETLQNEIKSTFSQNEILREVHDATLAQLNIISGNNDRKILIYLESSSPKKWEIIQKLIKLRECSLKSIKYHKFPKELLTATKPTPPPIEDYFND